MRSSIRPRLRAVLLSLCVTAGAATAVAPTTVDALSDLTNDISLVPNPVDFGRVVTGTESVKTVIITNHSIYPWIMTQFNLDPGPFRLSGGSCRSTVIDGDQQCSLVLTFAPTAAATFSARATLTNSHGETTQLPLTGVGGPPGPHASFSPSPVAFGNVLTGSVSDIAVTLTSDGDQAFAIGSASTGTPSIGMPSSTCGGSLAPGATCTVQLRFTPTVVGPVTGVLIVYDDRSVAVGSVNVTGAGVVARPVVTRVSPASGSVRGGTRVTITGINFSGATAVTFGTKRATKVSCTATRCVVTSPAGTGKVLVKVTTPKGTSRAVSTAYFTYR